MGQDYYNVLGVAKNASEADIKKSYKRLAMKYHPVIHTDKDAAEKNFKEIAESFEVLSDSQKRAIYDQYGEEGLKSGDGLAKVNGPYTPRDAEEIFKQFFGTNNPFSTLAIEDNESSGLFSKAMGPQKEAAKHLPVTLEKLYTGGVKKIKLTKQVLNTDGKTTYSVEKVFVINIKSGWKSGAKVTFPNEGNEGPGLLPADVVVIIEEKPHKNFSREGNNLIYTATVSLEKALTGFTLDIVSFRESEPTLDGRLLHIPVNDIVRPGYEKIVAGEGMPTKSQQKGELHIRFNIDFPVHLSPNQKTQIKQAFNAA